MQRSPNQPRPCNDDTARFVDDACTARVRRCDTNGADHPDWPQEVLDEINIDRNGIKRGEEVEFN